jgi:hypothetical protein
MKGILEQVFGNWFECLSTGGYPVNSLNLVVKSFVDILGKEIKYCNVVKGKAVRIQAWTGP